MITLVTLTFTTAGVTCSAREEKLGRRDKWVLTREVRHILQLFFPVLGDLDGLKLALLTGSGHALCVDVFEELFEEVALDRVHDVEEVLAAWALAFSERVGEVLGNVGVARELRPQRFHRELVVVRHVDVVYLGLLEQVLLSGEHLLEEVLVHGCGRWQVKLF